MIILAPLLGTYTTKFVGDSPIPAIWQVTDESIDPPHSFIAKGLECLVYHPRGYGSAMSHNSLFNEIYRIKLIQRDRSQRCTPAQMLILQHFPECQKSNLSMADRDTFEEMTLTISQSKVIN